MKTKQREQNIWRQTAWLWHHNFISATH